MNAQLNNYCPNRERFIHFVYKKLLIEITFNYHKKYEINHFLFKIVLIFFIRIYYFINRKYKYDKRIDKNSKDLDMTTNLFDIIN